MKEVYFDELVLAPIMSQINKRPNLQVLHHNIMTLLYCVVKM